MSMSQTEVAIKISRVLSRTIHWLAVFVWIFCGVLWCCFGYFRWEQLNANRSCVEVLGAHPTRPGSFIVINGDWKLSQTDFRVWDQFGHLVCDANGKETKP